MAIDEVIQRARGIERARRGETDRSPSMLAIDIRTDGRTRLTHHPVEPPESTFYTLEWEHKSQIQIAALATREADAEPQRHRQAKRDAMQERMRSRR